VNGQEREKFGHNVSIPLPFTSRRGKEICAKCWMGLIARRVERSARFHGRACAGERPSAED